MNAEAVFLRALEPDDLERAHRWHNDAALYGTLGGTFNFVSREAEQEWLRARCRFSREEISLAICLAETREHIGNIYLRGIDWVARHGEVSVFIGDAQHRGKRYGDSAVRQLREHAFRTLGLHRLYLFVVAGNDAAIRLYKRCGFAEEGRLREHVFKDGAFRDVLVMGLCAREED